MLESIYHALMQSDCSDPAEVCSDNFPCSRLSKLQTTVGNTIKSFLHFAFLSVLESRNEDEVGIMMLQHADNKPPLLPLSL